jgi:Zn-dependent oligopeptidase
MLNATHFNKGYDMTELLAAALLDMNWHGSAKPFRALTRLKRQH